MRFGGGPPSELLTQSSRPQAASIASVAARSRSRAFFTARRAWALRWAEPLRAALSRFCARASAGFRRGDLGGRRFALGFDLGRGAERPGGVGAELEAVVLGVDLVVEFGLDRDEVFARVELVVELVRGAAEDVDRVDHVAVGVVELDVYAVVAGGRVVDVHLDVGAVLAGHVEVVVVLVVGVGDRLRVGGAGDERAVGGVEAVVGLEGRSRPRDRGEGEGEREHQRERRRKEGFGLQGTHRPSPYRQDGRELERQAARGSQVRLKRSTAFLSPPTLR